MPVITVEGPELPDMDKRRDFARRLTDAAVQAYGLPEEAMVVIFHQNPVECVASGGQLICDRQVRPS